MRNRISTFGVILALCALGLSPAWAGSGDHDDYGYDKHYVGKKYDKRYGHGHHYGGKKYRKNSRLKELAYDLQVEAIDLERTVRRELRHRRGDYGYGYGRGHGKKLVYKLDRLTDAARDFYRAVEYYGPNRYKTEDAFCELQEAFARVERSRAIHRSGRKVRHDLKDVGQLIYRTERLYDSRRVAYKRDRFRKNKRYGSYGRIRLPGVRIDWD